MMNRIRNLWDGFSRRERWLVMLALFLAAILFSVFLLLRPAVNYKQSQERKLSRAELDLKLVKKARPALLQNKSGSSDIINLQPAMFQTIITRTAREKGLAIIRRQPRGERELVLWFEGVDTGLFFGWVHELTGKYNIQIKRAQLGRDDNGGIRVMIIFNLTGNV